MNPPFYLVMGMVGALSGWLLYKLWSVGRNEKPKDNTKRSMI